MAVSRNDHFCRRTERYEENGVWAATWSRAACFLGGWHGRSFLQGKLHLQRHRNLSWWAVLEGMWPGKTGAEHLRGNAVIDGAGGVGRSQVTDYGLSSILKVPLIPDALLRALSRAGFAFLGTTVLWGSTFQYFSNYRATNDPLVGNEINLVF